VRRATKEDYPPPVGAKLWTRWPEPNINNAAYHVRAHVDGMVVLRTWWRRRRRWHYVVEDRSWWDIVFMGSNGEIER